MRSFPISLLVLSLMACGAEGPAQPVDVETNTQEQAVTLRLETRDGFGLIGWALDRGSLVPAEEADFVVSSFDCGARGRWVSLVSSELEFCTSLEEDCFGYGAIEIGGSDPDVEVGDGFYAMRDGVAVAHILLIGRSETASNWYDEDPIAPFVVTLDVDTYTR